MSVNQLHEDEIDSLPAEMRVGNSRERYSYLVDKKYSSGLSEEENEELAHLKEQLDDEHAGLYEPIKQKLTAIQERLIAESQQQHHKE